MLPAAACQCMIRYPIRRSHLHWLYLLDMRHSSAQIAWCFAGANYAPLTAADRDQAGYCNDIQTLLPVYNPQAVIIPDETNSSVVVSPISTLLAFGWAYGKPAQLR